jgi:hypothetical protein
MSELAEELNETYHRFTFINGQAMGADIISDVVVQLLIDEDYELYGLGKPYDPERYPADWNAYGPGAGPIRNKQMLDSGIDYVVGFHDDIESSRGTRNMLRQCARASIPGRLFTQTEEVTDWQNLVS